MGVISECTCTNTVIANTRVLYRSHTRTVHNIVSVRVFSLLPPDPTLTLQNVTFAVLPVRDWKQLGESLGVPSLQIDEIDSKHPKREMKKLFALGYWLDYCPVVSWSKLASELYYWEEKESLQNVQGYLKKTPGMVQFYCATV